MEVHTLARKDGQSLQSYIDKPVGMGAAGTAPFGSGAPGVCWPNYNFGAAQLVVALLSAAAAWFDVVGTIACAQAVGAITP